MKQEDIISPVEQRAMYGQSIMASLTPARFRRIIDVLVEQAESGDLRAIALLLDRAIGARQSIGDLSEPQRNAWSEALETYKLRRGTGS